MIRNIIRKLLYKNTYSNEAYIKYLKNNNVSVGNNTYFFDPRTTYVDVNRGSYIKIGDNCKITARVMIMAHDYSWTTLIESNNVICPSGGKYVNIGDNVFIGVGAIILGDVTIGNNCIIGSGAVVTKDIPDNSIVVGNPAIIVKNTDQYKDKLQDNLINNSFRDIDEFIKTKGRFPDENECGRWSILFLDKNEENLKKYIDNNKLDGVDIKKLQEAFFNTPKLFNNYDELKNNYTEKNK